MHLQLYIILLSALHCKAVNRTDLHSYCTTFAFIKNRACKQNLLIFKHCRDLLKESFCLLKLVESAFVEEIPCEVGM